METKPRILLVEDEQVLRYRYRKNLVEVGFEVYTLANADDIEKFLETYDIDVILCDTNNEIGKLDGPAACFNALEEGILKEDVLIIGMSYDSRTNQPLWKGIAHHTGFYDKGYSNEEANDLRSSLGFKVMAHYNIFEKANENSSIRARML
ncbi:response regulator [Candidatus Pacearchaeota archaeon]|nr:response regulator [Candidatus Pacearchaeota archaeon]